MCINETIHAKMAFVSVATVTMQTTDKGKRAKALLLDFKPSIEKGAENCRSNSPGHSFGIAAVARWLCCIAATRERVVSDHTELPGTSFRVSLELSSCQTWAEVR